MASGTTPTYSLPYPLSTDAVDVAGDVQSLATGVETQLLLKAPLASPTFTGVPLSTTPSDSDNSTKIATTAFVKNQSYLTTTSASSTYAPLASPNFTGTPQISSVNIATTANISTHAALTTGVHGVSGTIVGTSETQTLSNKTLSSPIVSGTMSGDIIFSGANTHSGALSVTGRLDVQALRETVTDGTISTGVLTVDYTASNIVFVSTAPTANFTVNITNAPTENGKTFIISVMVTQGATGYIPNVLQVAGSSQTIKWLNGVTPTPTSSAGKIDVFNFTLIRRGSAWTVLANSSINF